MYNRNLLFHSLVVLSLSFCPLFSETAVMKNKQVEKKQIWILIHGTFAQDVTRVTTLMRWWKPKDAFYQELLASTPQATIYSFDWCGSNSHEKRIVAGKELANFITTIATQEDEINLVGHSHGANVAIVGAQELAKLQGSLKVSNLFCLGVPVSTAYYPFKKYVNNVYNLYSYADFVQPVVGLFERVYPEEDHIHNLQVKIDDICPNHHSIHSPLIARHLSDLRKSLQHSSPQLVHFFSHQEPEITSDETRKKDLEMDKYITNQLITFFAEGKKKGNKKLSKISAEAKQKVKAALAALNNQ